MDDTERQRIAALSHDKAGHRCSWACPQSNPLADIQALCADIGAGLTYEEIEARHQREAPLYGIPYGATEIPLDPP
jgi:hypothetical protein